MINYDDDDADDDDGDDDDDDDDDGLWWVTRQPFQRPTPFVVTQQGECQRMVTMLMGGHPRDGDDGYSYIKLWFQLWN